MYSLKKISIDADFEVFKNSYSASFSLRSKVAKREFKIDELKSQDFVYGIYNNNKMIAGFILNYFPNRCLESVEETQKNDIVKQLGQDNICELVGIWKSHDEKSILSTLTMWSFILTQTFGMKRSYIFGCNRSLKVGNNYYYQANYQIVPNQDEELLVFYYTRKQFLMTFLNSLFNFLHKKRTNSDSKTTEVA